MNCSVLGDLAQLKVRQRDVRPLHPEDMMHNDILVRLVASQRSAAASGQCVHQHAVCVKMGFILLLFPCLELQQVMVH